ncbi:hypothetical protein [Ramlibacter sp. Leaf400]|uniref:hypothetical protein n=1 Tax=Ramlibacter sp. Leaf400 TaxID=1736365 RepID=UPI0006F29B99|nr:hypothetical protein [Ramlibacter sp. Leaf400]KQT11585.1 hypothetical protein ASG30_06875 [Ramlibacter sp. Leaf400]
MFSVTVRDDTAYLVAMATGRAELAHLCGLADLAARIAVMKGHRRALVDLLEVQPFLTFTEHLQLGAHVAAAFGPLERVATVVPASQRNGTSEKAAQKHGLRLRTFTVLQEADAWLQERDTPLSKATRP